MKFKLLALVLTLSSPLIAATLTLDSIVSLNAAGVGDDAVIAAVKASGQQFDLSSEQIIELKNKGLSGKVLAAIIGAGRDAGPRVAVMAPDSPDPLVPHPSGVYLASEWSTPAKMIRIDATVSNQAKTGGIIGYALTGGIASLSVKAVIQNETARVRSPVAKPAFYFFFDESNAQGTATSGTWLSGTAATVSAPSEFSLISLMKKQGRREARVGSANVGGVKTGVLDKDRISFNYDLVRPGVFKVTPDKPLSKGEYGFIYAVNGTTTGGAVTARIFDFAVD